LVPVLLGLLAQARCLLSVIKELLPCPLRITPRPPPYENPAIGVLLCASKDDEVVEYALNRSLSPALIAEYQTQLPDKALLQAKLHEFYALNVATGEDT
jgi:YhcG PDDEXK nuclease domain